MGELCQLEESPDGLWRCPHCDQGPLRIGEARRRCRQLPPAKPGRDGRPPTLDEIADRLRAKRDRYIDKLIDKEFAQVDKQTILDRIAQCETADCTHLKGHCTRRGSGCQAMEMWLQQMSQTSGSCDFWK